jgi:hypothetical protein
MFVVRIAAQGFDCRLIRIFHGAQMNIAAERRD